MALNERPETPNEIVELPLREPAAHTLRRVLNYVLVKGVTILVTNFIGVFITVLLANRGGQVDATVRQEFDNRMDIEFPG